MTPQRALGAYKQNQNLQLSGCSSERWKSPFLFVFLLSNSLKDRGRTKLLNEPVNVPVVVVYCEVFAMICFLEIFGMLGG